MGGQVIDVMCVNPKCNYSALGEVCTKCGAIQDIDSFIRQKEDELKQDKADLQRIKEKASHLSRYIKTTISEIVELKKKI
jgi:hypothetical protein